MNALFAISRKVSNKLPKCFTIINQDIQSSRTFKNSTIVDKKSGIKKPISLSSIILPCGYPESVRESNHINRLFYLCEAYCIN
jgi:hypothetical protein